MRVVSNLEKCGAWWSRRGFFLQLLSEPELPAVRFPPPSLSEVAMGVGVRAVLAARFAPSGWLRGLPLRSLFLRLSFRSPSREPSPPEVAPPAEHLVFAEAAFAEAAFCLRLYSSLRRVTLSALSRPGSSGSEPEPDDLSGGVLEGV